MILLSAVEFPVISVSFTLILKCHATFIKADGLLTSARQNKHYLSMSSNSDTISDPFCSSVSQPCAFLLSSALLFNLVDRYPHKLTEWPCPFPLGFHWTMSPPSTCQRSCWGDLPVLSRVRESWLLNSATGQTVTLLLRAGCTSSSSLPTPTVVFCISFWLFFLMLRFISFSAIIAIMLHSTNARLIRDTLSSPSALPSWSLSLLKLFKLSAKCYAITFWPHQQGLTQVWITGGWYLAAT